MACDDSRRNDNVAFEKSTTERDETDGMWHLSAANQYGTIEQLFCSTYAHLDWIAYTRTLFLLNLEIELSLHGLWRNQY
eukprot:scaffold1064_cov85-Amphora_coffeaeformis.AAC.8